MSFISSQLYVGTNLDFPSPAHQGDMFLDVLSQRTYCFDNAWMEIKTNEPTVALQKYTRGNCPNCGAPVQTNRDYCPYCDTPYLFLEDFV